MKKNCIACLIGFTLVYRLGSTLIPIQQLANDLDRITPGGSDWFVKWGQEEILLDFAEAVLSRRISPSAGSPKIPIGVASIGYFVLYKNPAITLSGFIAECSAYALSLNVQATQTRWARFFNLQQSFTTCPPWLHNKLTELKLNRVSRSSIVREATDLIRQRPELSNEFRFHSSVPANELEIHYSTLVRIWYEFCIDAPSGSCQFDPAIQRWVPTIETHQRITRYMFLVIIKQV